MFAQLHNKLTETLGSEELLPKNEDDESIYDELFEATRKIACDTVKVSIECVLDMANTINYPSSLKKNILDEMITSFVSTMHNNSPSPQLPR